jgi:hypothetical protein
LRIWKKLLVLLKSLWPENSQFTKEWIKIARVLY